MSNKNLILSQSRRGFLRGTLTAGAGTALAVLAPKGVAAVAEDDSPPQGERKSGYRLTGHIADYYKSASY